MRQAEGRSQGTATEVDPRRKRREAGETLMDIARTTTIGRLELL